MDNITEEIVMNRVMDLLRTQTVIVIAHRLNSIRKFEHIVFKRRSYCCQIALINYWRIMHTLKIYTMQAHAINIIITASNPLLRILNCQLTSRKLYPAFLINVGRISDIHI